jgi:hypothetical protein
LLLCQEEYKEWNGVYLQLQSGLGEQTGSNACAGQKIVMDILGRKSKE